MNPLLHAALQWHASGCSVIPDLHDGSKAPAVAWTPYMTTRADEAQLHTWFGNGSRHGLGIICGTVSGQLEMYEFEGRAVAEGLVARFTEAMRDHGQIELWTRLLAGYLERTPSGGFHLYYRVDGEARPNTKLARRPATEAELAVSPQEKIKVLIETRGNGGFVVIAPTPATHHELGKPWEVIQGSAGTIPVLTEDERDTLHAIATLFDELPARETYAPLKPGSTAATGDRPGDIYNARATWDDILVPQGWTRLGPIGSGWLWRRPGKNRGQSATTGTRPDIGDNLYVFTSSTEFETEQPYDKFGAYALLHHGGDIRAAASDLAGQGFKGKSKGPTSTPIPTNVTPIRTYADTGTSLFDVVATAVPLQDGQIATVAQFVPSADSPLMTERQTDDGNANALISAHGEDMRYCNERGRWLTWNEYRWVWQPAGGGYAREYVKDVARALPDVTEYRLWRNKSLGAVGTTNTLIQAATDPRVVVALTELDAQAWSLNTPAGVVDLHTGELGDPADHALHTRSTTAVPDTAADPSVWLEFLAVTFNGDSELIGYMQRLVGYSATGYVGPHVLPFAYGSGGNGKGVFLESIGKVLGDYATTGPNSFLMARQHPGHDTEIARLSGARMVLCSEVNEADRFDEAKVKQLTGGDTLTARFMRQDFFSFEPTHHLWLMGNHKPAVTTGGRSFWRRCRLIPFLHEVPPEAEIDDLQGILARDHGPAILSWIIAGAVDFASGGLREPESVKAATAEYAKDQDTVGRFVEEMTSLAPNSTVVKTEVSALAAAYVKWCEEMGEEGVTGKRLSMDLANRYGVRSGRDNRRRWYLGIALNDTAPPWQRGPAEAPPPDTW
jgi:putative DNA primase/helicase